MSERNAVCFVSPGVLRDNVSLVVPPSLQIGKSKAANTLMLNVLEIDVHGKLN